MRLLDPALLDPLSRFHPAEEAEFECISPDELPSEMRRLLVHGGDMTSRLEALHGSAIRLEVLKSEHSSEAVYSREVLLRSISSGRSVEYGAIQIFLDAFQPSVRARILEGRIPLGGILNSSGMRYYSEPQAFFFVKKGRRLAGLLEVESSSRLCGRCNVLRGEGGEMLARIVEVVPPLAQESMSSPGHASLESSSV